MKRMYHYRASGLDNVWLVNGFQIRKTSHGEGISIEDIQGLHDAIGRHLVDKPGGLNAKEVRFMRKELELSQKSLATLLGADEQTVSRWERGGTMIPAAADRLLRAYYREMKEGGARIQELLTRLSQLETRPPERKLGERPLRLKRAKADGVQEWKAAA